jgi:hypothetical protein
LANSWVKLNLIVLSKDQLTELRHFLSRLQGQEVRVEISSRLNIGMRVSHAVLVEPSNDTYSFVSKSGEISIFFDPNEAEAFSADGSSVTVLYGDDLVTVRYARKR